jgi:SAM-dependent methyltransferase
LNKSLSTHAGLPETQGVFAPQGESFRCRACGAEDGLEPILDLGPMPLANRLLTAEQLNEPEPTFPLRLVFCRCCTLLQITETVPPEILFRNYLYFSSFSDAMVRHAREIAERTIAERGLGSDSLVMEAASNDGYLLQHFARRGVPVLGIEPARNVASVARDHGVPTVSEFFGSELAVQFRREGKGADIFFANNVLAHVADLNDFVRGIQRLLKADGRAIIEVPYAKDMLDKVEFDTIYHEHLCYFSLTALDRLFREHRLLIEAVERLPIHGGTLRLFVGHEKAIRSRLTVTDLLSEEARWGVDRPEGYRDFAGRVECLKASLYHLLVSRQRQG